jgi:hypothetical protein
VYFRTTTSRGLNNLHPDDDGLFPAEYGSLAAYKAALDHGAVLFNTTALHFAAQSPAIFNVDNNKPQIFSWNTMRFEAATGSMAAVQVVTPATPPPMQIKNLALRQAALPPKTPTRQPPKGT